MENEPFASALPSPSPEATYTPFAQVSYAPPSPTPTGGPVPVLTTAPPTPSPTLFPAYVTVYPRAVEGGIDGGKPVRIELGQILSEELEEAIHQRPNNLTIPNLSKGEYFLEPCVFVHTSKTKDEYGSSIKISNKGLGIIVINESLSSYTASELCQKIMDLVAEKMKWEYITQQDIHDIIKAELYVTDGSDLLKRVTEPEKLAKLENLLTGAVSMYYPSTFWVGPKLVLTRKDGKKLTIWPTLGDDKMIFDPWYFYDLGHSPTGESADNTPAFLSVFGLKQWPKEVYYANGQEWMLEEIK